MTRLPVPVKAVIDERFARRLPFRSRQGGAVHDQAVEYPVAGGRESDEAAAPEGLIAEGLGIEACGQFAAIAEPDADALGHDHPRASEYAAEQVAQIGLVPASIDPGVIALIAPVSQFSTIEPGVLGQQDRDGALLREMLGLLGVEVINAVAVDRMLPVRPLLRVHRVAIERELGRNVRMAEQVAGGSQPRTAEVQQEADEVAALGGCHRVGEPARASASLRCGRLRCRLRSIRITSPVAGSRSVSSVSDSACS